MRFFRIAVLSLLTLIASNALGAVQAPQYLPTGQTLAPTAAPGSRFTPLAVHIGQYPSYVADGASAIALGPDEREMLILTSGYNRFNGADGKLVPQQSSQYIFRYKISQSGAQWLQTLQVPNSFGGIAWLPDGNGFIVGGGVDDAVYLFTRRGASFGRAGTIRLGHEEGLGDTVKPQTAGVAVSADGRRALVANYYNDSLSLVDLRERKVVAEQDLRPGKIDPIAAGVAGGEFPFAVVWVDAGRAWVSSPRDRQLVALSITGTSMRVTARVKTIGEPTALLFDRTAHRLIATEDNADRLALVDTDNGRIVAEPRLVLPTGLRSSPSGQGT